jgi:hypothetical protein
MKAFGRDIKDFYDNHWPTGHYHDDANIEFHDQDKAGPKDEPIWVLEDSTRYDLDDCGIIVRESDGETYSFATIFQQYLKARDYAMLTVSVPKGKVAEFRAACKAMGAKC